MQVRQKNQEKINKISIFLRLDTILAPGKREDFSKKGEKQWAFCRKLVPFLCLFCAKYLILI